MIPPITNPHRVTIASRHVQVEDLLQEILLRLRSARRRTRVRGRWEIAATAADAQCAQAPSEGPIGPLNIRLEGDALSRRSRPGGRLEEFHVSLPEGSRKRRRQSARTPDHRATSSKHASAPRGYYRVPCAQQRRAGSRPADHDRHEQRSASSGPSRSRARRLHRQRPATSGADRRDPDVREYEQRPARSGHALAERGPSTASQTPAPRTSSSTAKIRQKAAKAFASRHRGGVDRREQERVRSQPLVPGRRPE